MLFDFSSYNLTVEYIVYQMKCNANQYGYFANIFEVQHMLIVVRIEDHLKIVQFSEFLLRVFKLFIFCIFQDFISILSFTTNKTIQDFLHLA